MQRRNKKYLYDENLSVFDGVTGHGETNKLKTSDYQKQLNKLQTLIESLDTKYNPITMKRTAYTRKS